MNQPNQQLIRTSVIIVIIAGLFGALSILADNIGFTSAKMVSLCFSLIILGITATISMVVTRKPEYKTLGMAGIVTSAACFMLLLLIILAEITNEEILKLAFTLFIASIAIAHISLLHHFNLQNKYALYARVTATIAISIFSIVLITRIFEPFPSLYSLAYSQGAMKILVAALIIDLAATLLVPLCNRLHVQGPAEVLSFEEEKTVTAEEQDPAI
jgi:hypothetical protein